VDILWSSPVINTAASDAGLLRKLSRMWSKSMPANIDIVSGKLPSPAGSTFSLLLTAAVPLSSIRRKEVGFTESSIISLLFPIFRISMRREDLLSFEPTVAIEFLSSRIFIASKIDDLD